MSVLNHAIHIEAPRADCFRALATIEGRAAWHLEAVEGEIAPGAVFTLAPKPGLRFGWRTEALDPETRIAQTCVEGPRGSPGRTLTITLSDLTDGRTRVDLADAGWEEGDPHLPVCNTSWGEAPGHLRTCLEHTDAHRPRHDLQHHQGLRGDARAGRPSCQPPPGQPSLGAPMRASAGRWPKHASS